jgi:hypothetical protein
MKLEKGKGSAVIMSACGVLSFSLVDAAMNLLLPYLVSGDINTVIANPESLEEPGNLLGLVLFLVGVILILIAVGAFWLHRFFGDAYYGGRGAVRWALFGSLFAVFLKVPEWIFPQYLWILRAIMQFGGLFAAFFLSRWLIPTLR